MPPHTHWAKASTPFNREPLCRTSAANAQLADLAPCSVNERAGGFWQANGVSRVGFLDAEVAKCLP
jgi:hypothetical protein